MRTRFRWLAPVVALSLLAWLPLGVLAQDVHGWRQRPSGRELTAPEYAKPAPALPLEAPPTQVDEPPLSKRERVFVRRFELSGNTVFTAEELAAVTAPYENRTLTAEELQEARRQLTLYYVERGYLNSGAVIPDQKVEDGVVGIRIVEGRLSEVEVTGNTHLRAGYVRNRLRPEPDAPLNVQELQERLQILQQNPLVEQLQAELAPGVQPGESVLRLGIREARPYEIGLALANNNPPSVGATRAYLYGLDRNLTGVGDSLGLSYGHSSGEQHGRLAGVLRPAPKRARYHRAGVGRAERNLGDRGSVRTLDITSQVAGLRYRVDPSCLPDAATEPVIGLESGTAT